MRVKRHGIVRLVLIVVACVMAAPAVYAQSQISGRVTDDTEGILPGVTVELTGEALIEGTRVAVTDGAGQYSITNLRPGEYAATYTLPGFSTVIREELALPVNFTMTVNVALMVGGVQETITVSGESPIVDVAQAQRTQVLDRDVVDALPLSRTYQAIGAALVGIRMNRPDVGGTQAMQQTYLRVHGNTSRDNTIQFDGMDVNGLNFDGVVQNYFNDAVNAEVAYQISGVGAETSTGGVRVNMIPKQGGNQFSGAAFVSGTPSSWQNDNFTQKLMDRGLQNIDSVDKVFDYQFSLGGPILQDRLWFFGASRYNGVDAPTGGTFKTAAHLEQGVDDQNIKSVQVRLTYQISPQNKLTVYGDRIFKFRGHEMGAGTEADTASRRWEPKIYFIGQAKLTTTLSSRLLFEIGYSSNLENNQKEYQEGIRKERGSPEWFAQTARRDFGNGRRWGAHTSGNAGTYPERFVLQSSATYVTGSHNFKGGFTWNFGPDLESRVYNGDLYQRYEDGVPDGVTVYNSPFAEVSRLNYDLGLYAQDSWTVDRLTINPAVRFDILNAKVGESAWPAGRFVPARRLPEIPNLPDWFDVSPRFGLAYDLFGDASTALKFSAGKYVRSTSTGFANRYNPNGIRSDTVDWFDCDLSPGTSNCSGLAMATNGDDIAQDNEIAIFDIPTGFGSRQINRPDPDLEREYNVQINVGVQREVLPGVSVSLDWYRRTLHNTRITDNLLIGPEDYIPLEVLSPYGDEVITVYDLRDRSLRGVRDNLDINQTEAFGDRSLTYNGIELTISARLPGGGQVMGGFTSFREIGVSCDNPDSPDRRFCDQNFPNSRFSEPWATDFKVAGFYPMPAGIQASAVLQAYSPLGLREEFRYSQSGRYRAPYWTAANCVLPCVLGERFFPSGRLNRASSITTTIIPNTTEKFRDRWIQLDAGVKKIFTLDGRELHLQYDLFNATNSDAAITDRSQRINASLFEVPNRVMPGRLSRVAVQFKF